MTTRIATRFAALGAEGRAGLVTFLTAGDPDAATSAAILKGAAQAGADLIELGMPFTDPMADGPAIQAANLRALKAGMTLRGVLALARALRQADDATPLVLMGYYNPIMSYGKARFLADAKSAGVDGLIIIDLPPEEDDELCLPARAAGFDVIRLATPTTDDRRLPKVLSNSSGFLYYVSITGITGARAGGDQAIANALARIKRHTDLPVAVGFGIKTPDDAARTARAADAVVVGSALVQRVASAIAEGRIGVAVAAAVHHDIRALAQAVRSARTP